MHKFERPYGNSGQKFRRLREIKRRRDGGSADEALRSDFDRRQMGQFRSSAVTSDAGLLARRAPDDTLGLTDGGPSGWRTRNACSTRSVYRAAAERSRGEHGSSGDDSAIARNVAVFFPRGRIFGFDIDDFSQLVPPSMHDHARRHVVTGRSGTVDPRDRRFVLAGPGPKERRSARDAGPSAAAPDRRRSGKPGYY